MIVDPDERTIMIHALDGAAYRVAQTSTLLGVASATLAAAVRWPAPAAD